MPNGQAIPPMATVMMTLAGLAATAPEERPSSESVEMQEKRMLDGINAQLDAGNLSAIGWSAVWAGLTEDRANFAYIAVNGSQIAVVLRGTWFGSAVDLSEDMDVGNVVQLTGVGEPRGTTLLISQGAMNAHAAILSALYYPPDGGTPTTMTEALQTLIAGFNDPQLFITGHSLGGAMATTVALLLVSLGWSKHFVTTVFTFAAPTAGLGAFANYYDSVFAHAGPLQPNTSWRIYNAWDVVPNAWASLQDVLTGFYPPPGPEQNTLVNQLIQNMLNQPANNFYAQTNRAAGTVVLNGNVIYGQPGCAFDGSLLCTTTGDFLGQLAYQHSNDTYLGLLGAQPLSPTVPVVTAVQPNHGTPGAETNVTISGSNFSSDSVVDFGPVAVPKAKVNINSPSEIVITSVPLVLGTVDVRVTNMGGTSAVVAGDQFTAGPIVAGPVVTPISPYVVGYAITPNGGPEAGGTTVTVSGTGFVNDGTTTVNFGGVAGSNVVVISLTELTVTTPPGSGTVDVTVSNWMGTSEPHPPTTNYTYGLPLVTSVSPSCGPAKNGANVTIEGEGFSLDSDVTFLNNSFNKTGTIVANQSNPPTMLVVTPPNVDLIPLQTNPVADVVVTTGGETSATSPADQFTFYPS
jgi:hypothetical protein